MARRRFHISGLLAAAAGWAAIGGLQPAWAQEPALSSLATVGLDELAEQRAGTLSISDNIGEILVAQSQQSVTGTTNPTLTAESANGGDIFIGDEALSNARGMINLNVNSGHNAFIQGVMSLTVVMTGAP